MHFLINFVVDFFLHPYMLLFVHLLIHEYCTYIRVLLSLPHVGWTKLMVYLIIDIDMGKF